MVTNQKRKKHYRKIWLELSLFEPKKCWPLSKVLAKKIIFILNLDPLTFGANCTIEEDACNSLDNLFCSQKSLCECKNNSYYDGSECGK